MSASHRIHPLNADYSDCCARNVILTIRCLGLSCIRHCSCAPDCLQLYHGLLCVSFGRTVHICTAESLPRFNPFGILPLPLTVARDASDRPSAEQSPLVIPTQPLRSPRAGRPIVSLCASSTTHRLDEIGIHSRFTCPRNSLPSTPPGCPATQSCLHGDPCHCRYIDDIRAVAAVSSNIGTGQLTVVIIARMPALHEHHQLLSVSTREDCRIDHCGEGFHDAVEIAR